jgi:hypothetical protein
MDYAFGVEYLSISPGVIVVGSGGFGPIHVLFCRHTFTQLNESRCPPWYGHVQFTLAW